MDGPSTNEEIAMQDNDGWKEHAEWHYAKEARNKMLYWAGIVLGSIATAACLYLLTVLLFLL
jgi:hypothetical protein